MANIKSIGGNPIVVGLDGLTNDAKVTLLANRPSATLSGSIVTADDAAPTTPIALSVYGQSVQDGTPTPSAPVPIVSVEGDSEGNISLVAQGLNVAHPVPGTRRENKGITATVGEDGWITISGTSTATSPALVGIGIGSTDNRARTIEGAPTFALFIENEGALVSGEIELQVYGSNGEATNVGGYAAASRTFDTLTDYISRIYVFLRAASNGKTYDGRFRFSLVRSDQMPTEYIPYVETVTPIDLDGHELRSLPDGTRDEVTVDQYGHAILTQRVGEMELPTTGWIANTLRGENVFYMNASGPQSNPSLLDRFAPATSVSALVGTMGMAAYGGYNPNSRVTPLNLSFPSGVNTEALAQQWLTDNPTTLLYALLTPVTHDLGTVPLVPLVGPDLTAQTVPSAPLALTYERDATIVLDRLTAMWANIAPVEGDTASASYSVGSYLMHGGQLCKVTTAIATGETIAIGTNVTATTVMAEVIALTQ